MNHLSLNTFVTFRYLFFSFSSTLHSFSQDAATAAAAQPASTDLSQHRLYVGSVNFDLTEDDLKQVLEPFGPIEFIKLHRDAETGKSKGFAFVQ